MSERRKSRVTPHRKLNEDELFIADPITPDQLKQPIDPHQSMREWFAKYLVVASSIATLASAFVSAWERNWMPLAMTWSVVGPVIGGLFQFYFAKGRDSPG